MWVPKWRRDRNKGFESPMPKKSESSEQRSFEFELKTPMSQSEATTLKAYALYYVCETTRGACQFLRQDVEIPINIAGKGYQPSR